MNKPIIGISGSLIIDEGGMFPGYRRAYVNYDYVLSVIKAGGIPFIIPFNEESDIVKTQIQQVDGLILSGGHDVCPTNYGKAASPNLQTTFPERDVFDMGLLEEAEKLSLPILGICRGAQIMNVFHGGTIYQDLSEYPKENVLAHNQGHTPTLESHVVDILPESKLHQAFSSEAVSVNSFHHQVLEEVPSSFKVTATSDDGVIEGIEHQMYDWQVGVQWHPEMLHGTNDKMANLFRQFVLKASERMSEVS